ncbi:MAG: ABC transporter substrate-binding protein [Flavobacteriia bacterium]
MTFTDQMNRTISLDNIPKRIVSLVPSQTEFLCDLGLEEDVVGITKFCIYPDEWYKTKFRVGGTKNVDIEKVKSLKPDLIIGNKEENTEADIIELEKIAPVWMSDIYTLEDAYEMMFEIGKICNLNQKVVDLINEIKGNFVNQFQNLKSNKTAIYLIWNEPLMAVGKQTFINQMLKLFGLKNLYANEERYPIVDLNESYDVDFVLLSSEPFPFKEEHKVELQKKFPKAKIIFVDGEMFSWYGSRLKHVPAYFTGLKKEFF